MAARFGAILVTHSLREDVFGRALKFEVESTSGFEDLDPTL
jgi:hypothetical protein